MLVSDPFHCPLNLYCLVFPLDNTHLFFSITEVFEIHLFSPSKEDPTY